MEVTIDQALCTGCGLCIEQCADVFGWGSDGKAVVLKQESETCSIEEIADSCPAEAINI